MKSFRFLLVILLLTAPLCLAARPQPESSESSAATLQSFSRVTHSQPESSESSTISTGQSFSTTTHPLPESSGSLLDEKLSIGTGWGGGGDGDGPGGGGISIGNGGLGFGGSLGDSFNNGASSYGGSGPFGSFSTGGGILGGDGAVTCPLGTPCAGRHLICPQRCYNSFKGSGLGYGYGGASEGCNYDCFIWCQASC